MKTPRFFKRAEELGPAELMNLCEWKFRSEERIFLLRLSRAVYRFSCWPLLALVEVCA